VQGEEAAQAAAILEDGAKGKGLQFSDKDEHMYFWFPLLAGLSELTFDPRPDIRYSALEVLLLHIFCAGRPYASMPNKDLFRRYLAFSIRGN
jgi:hypothetical protein